MCGVQAAADRVGQPWDVVGNPLASESEPEGRVEANTTPTSKPPMVSPSKTTTRYSPLKEASVQSAKVVRVNDTLQWTIIIETEELEDFSALAAILASLVSWIKSRLSDERSAT